MKILINEQKQENIKAIQINDYFVIVDIKAEIKIDDFYINSKTVLKCSEVEKRNSCYKIIASTKRIDSSIPLIVFKEQTVDELAKFKYLMEESNSTMNMITTEKRKSYVEGYNKAISSDKKYTEEDILNAIQFTKNLSYMDGTKPQYLFSSSDILSQFQSLNQPKLPDVINLEMEEIKGIIIDGISEESIKNAIDISVNILKTTSTLDGEIIEITI